MLKHQGLQEGGAAPDFTLPAVDGSILSLYDGLQRSSRILLVFLRHLGWLVCREHVAQLCQYQDELKQLNTEVWVISFGTLEMALGWLEDTCAPFTMLLDEERKVYKGYGMRHS